MATASVNAASTEPRVMSRNAIRTFGLPNKADAMVSIDITGGDGLGRKLTTPRQRSLAKNPRFYRMRTSLWPGCSACPATAPEGVRDADLAPCPLVLGAGRQLELQQGRLSETHKRENATLLQAASVFVLRVYTQLIFRDPPLLQLH
jgi:hypothetical protein